MGFDVHTSAVRAGQCDGDEVHGLFQAVVGFGTTDAVEAATGTAEVFVF